MLPIYLHHVDADDLPVLVDERAAGVAVVERGVGLDERHGHAVHIDVAVDGGHDAVGQRAAQLHATRVADGVDRVAEEVYKRQGGEQMVRDVQEEKDGGRDAGILAAPWQVSFYPDTDEPGIVEILLK